MPLPTIALLRLNGCRTGIHIRLHRIVMLLQVLQDLILQDPVEEVQLPDSGVESQEGNLLPATEGIKHLFAIGPQVRLVAEVDIDVALVGRQIRNVVLLCVVGDEPVQKAKADRRLSRDDGLDPGKNRRITVECREAPKHHVFLGCDCLHGCVRRFHRKWVPYDMSETKLPDDFWTVEVPVDPLAMAPDVGADLTQIEAATAALESLVLQMWEDMTTETKLLEGTEIPDREELTIPRISEDEFRAALMQAAPENEQAPTEEPESKE
jgi:hypothetical protein